MYNYSGSKCPKCEKTSFELVEDAPSNGAFKIYFIRCSACKTIVGTRDYTNTNSLIRNLAQALGVGNKID